MHDKKQNKTKKKEFLEGNFALRHCVVFCETDLQDNHLFYTNHSSLWLPKLTLIAPSMSISSSDGQML